MTTELSQPLFATALRLSRNRAEAEDLVQETLFRAFRAIASFRRGTRFRAWMFRILHNVFINRSKRQSMAPKALDPHEMREPEATTIVPDIREIEQLAGLADEHFDQQVKAAIDGLAEVYRVPMVLFSLADMSYAEIAATLDIPIGTVMSRLHRARRQLRQELAAYAADSGHLPNTGHLPNAAHLPDAERPPSAGHPPGDGRGAAAERGGKL